MTMLKDALLEGKDTEEWVLFAETPYIPYAEKRDFTWASFAEWVKAGDFPSRLWEYKRFPMDRAEEVLTGYARYQAETAALKEGRYIGEHAEEVERRMKFAEKSLGGRNLWARIMRMWYGRLVKSYPNYRKAAEAAWKAAQSGDYRSAEIAANRRMRDLLKERIPNNHQRGFVQDVVAEWCALPTVRTALDVKSIRVIEAAFGYVRNGGKF